MPPPPPPPPSKRFSYLLGQVLVLNFYTAVILSLVHMYQCKNFSDLSNRLGPKFNQTVGAGDGNRFKLNLVFICEDRTIFQ